MAALQGYGVSTSLAVRIYKRFGDDSAPGDRPGAVPAGPRGLGHRLQDRRQDRPGGRHRPRRPRAAPGRGAARPGAGGRRGAHPAARSRTWSTQAAELLGAEPAGVGAAIAALLGDGRRWWRRRGRARRAGCSPWRPSPAPSRAWPPGCRRSTAAAGADARSGRPSPPSTGRVAFGWLAERHGLTPGPGAGGRGADGPDRPGRRS